MIFWRKKENASVDLSWLHTDMHSHLVPGIDDGSPDAATSLQLIKGMQDLGFQKIITTPHILSDLYPNTPDSINKGLAELKNAAVAEGMSLDIHAAAEYFIDDQFQQLLAQKSPLLTLSDNMVLVEYSMVTAPYELQDILFELQMQQYQPVIAHPERYIYLTRKKDFFDTLKDSGCYFQLNLLSLTGHYGTSVQELAEYLAKKNYYDFAGTDLHGQKHLDGLRKLGSCAVLNKLRDSGVLRNIDL
jgi:tyrosine-protein phosphatase YwqE